MAKNLRHLTAKIGKKDFLWLLLFLFTLTVYILTSPTWLTWRHGGSDGAEFATAAYTFALPHPSGYPTYTVIGFLLTRIFNDPVAVLTRFSSLCAALALIFVGKTAEHLSGSTTAAVVATLMLAFSALWWSQAIIIEVYALMCLVWAVLIWSIITKRLTMAAFVLGLALTHHLVLLWGIPGLLSLIWLSRWRLHPRHILFFTAPLAIWLILFWMAASDALPWKEAFKQHGALWYVTGRYYAPFQFHLEQVLKRFQDIIISLSGGIWFALISIGLFSLRRDRATMPLLLSGAGIAFYALSYTGPDTNAYLLPVLCIGAVFVATGIAAFPINSSFFVIVPLVFLLQSWAAVDLRQDTTVQQWIDNVISPLPTNSVLFSNDDGHTFTLWYMQIVEQRRTDLVVVDIAGLQRDWFRLWLQARYHLNPVTDITSIVESALAQKGSVFTTERSIIPANNKWQVQKNGKLWQIRYLNRTEN